MTSSGTVLSLTFYSLWFATVLFAQDAVVQAPSTARSDSSKGPSAEAVDRGRDQFAKNCSFCHGANATGTSNGPNLILSTIVRHDQHGDQIGPVVRQGRPDKGMPAFNLTDAEINNIVAFLHARMAASDVRSANRTIGGYSLDKLLTGKPESGKSFFFGAGKCSTCHSPTGDLAGIAGKYPPSILQSRMLYPPDSHQTATVVDESGHEWKGPLVSLTNFDVAIRDSDGWYHSWPLDAVKLHIEDPLAGHLALLSKYSDTDMHNVFAYLESLK